MRRHFFLHSRRHFSLDSGRHFQLRRHFVNSRRNFFVKFRASFCNWGVIFLHSRRHFSLNSRRHFVTEASFSAIPGVIFCFIPGVIVGLLTSFQVSIILEIQALFRYSERFKASFSVFTFFSGFLQYNEQIPWVVQQWDVSDYTCEHTLYFRNFDQLV